MLRQEDVWMRNGSGPMQPHCALLLHSISESCSEGAFGRFHHAPPLVQVRSDLEDVIVALDLARATFRRIQVNYVWALAYNVLMVPVAAGVLYPAARIRLPPVLAGLAMAFSSVSVVCSSLMLSRYRRPPPVLRDFA
jgi:hypothetical protein